MKGVQQVVNKPPDKQILFERENKSKWWIFIKVYWLIPCFSSDYLTFVVQFGHF